MKYFHIIIRIGIKVDYYVWTGGGGGQPYVSLYFYISIPTFVMKSIFFTVHKALIKQHHKNAWCQVSRCVYSPLYRKL